jgi:threonine/homoserine/homoserine lactone efflux protein
VTALRLVGIGYLAWTAVRLLLAVYAAATAVTETHILIAYGWIASRGGALFPEGRVGPWPDWVAGACLLAVAGWLLLRG